MKYAIRRSRSFCACPASSGTAISRCSLSTGKSHGKWSTAWSYAIPISCACSRPELQLSYPYFIADVHFAHVLVQLLLLFIEVDVRLLQLENGARKQSIGFPDMPWLNFEANLESSVSL